MKQATTLLFSNGLKYSPGSLYYKTFTVVIILLQYCKLVLLSLLVSSNVVCYLLGAFLLEWLHLSRAPALLANITTGCKIMGACSGFFSEYSGFIFEIIPF
jgi:hypothetical protein